jgi:PAS domain S-box-containing protein
MKDIINTNFSKLRMIAEEMLKKNSSPPEKIYSSNEILKIVHELEIHKIELEMQNKELIQEKKQSADALDKYIELYDFAPTGYLTLTKDGKIIEINFTGAKILGKDRSHLKNKMFILFVSDNSKSNFNLFFKKILNSRYNESCEVGITTNDDIKKQVLISGISTSDGENCLLSVTDISEQKMQEEVHKETSRLIIMINSGGDLRECISSLTASLKAWSGCEAVGIRLKENDDFPYFETIGFPPKFVYTEKYLCSYGKDGKILKDDVGNPVLECMCGNILRGRFDISKPFFTPKGSFWSNDTTDLLASTTDTDRQARTRNRCNGEGYESVALIPMRTGDKVLGLLQFNDHRTNRFTKYLIESLEKIAETMAVALSRRFAEEALNRSQLLLSSTQKLTKVGGWEWNIEKQTMYWTNELYRIHDIEPKEILPGAPEHINRGLACYLPEDRPVILEAFNKCAEKGIPYDLEFPFITEKGRHLWIRTFTEPVYENGKIVRVVGFFMDITDSKKAEQTLKENENKYRELVENSPDAIAIYRDRKVVFANSECLKLMSAKSLNDLIGKPLIEFVHPDSRALVIERMKKVMNPGTVLPIAEEKFILLDGSEIDVEVKAMSIIFNNQPAVQLILRDISQRKLTEIKLLESEERYKRIAEGITDYLYTVIVKNGKAIKTLHNESCKAITGYSSKEFSNNPNLWINMVVPDDRESVTGRFIKILQGEDLPPSEHRIICKNGKIRWIRDTFIPKYDFKGKLISYDGVIKDITEQKETEKILNARLHLSDFALSHSKNEFQQELLNELELLTGSTIGFFHSVDPDQKRLVLQSWSTNTLAKMCKAEGIGQHYEIDKAGVWVDCFHQRKSVIHNDYLSIPHRKGMPVGHAPVIRELVVPLFRNKLIVAIVGIGNKPTDYTKRDSEIVSLLSDMAWDIIDRKRAEEELIIKNEELLAVNAEKDKFFSIIAHDLRSPFNAFLGFTQMMAEELNTMSIREVQTIAVSMRNSATNLFQLLENLLEWSRFQRGVTGFDPETILLVPKIEECMESVSESATKKGIEIEFDIPDGLVIFADEKMFDSIIRNITFNAVKFTSNGGSITIAAKYASGNFVEISIKDTGIGMNKDVLNNIFMQNEISKRTGTEGELSTGLGLLICKEFIEKHGGKIWVESVEEKGSVFSFTLPATS